MVMIYSKFMERNLSKIFLIRKTLLMLVVAMLAMVAMSSCSSDNDELDSLPWNNKGLFDKSYVVSEDGCCLLQDTKPLSAQELEKVLVDYGWQPVGIYQVKSDGKLSTSDYREGMESNADGDDYQKGYSSYSPTIYQFLSNSELKKFYSDAGTGEKCFQKLAWSYDDERGIILCDKPSNLGKDWRYLQVLDVKNSGENTYLYTLEKIGSKIMGDNKVESIFALVVRKRLTSNEMSNVKNTYSIDKSEKEEEPKIPDDCQYYIRCSYVNAEDGYDYYHSKFQSFRQVRLELTDEKGNNFSSNPYYQYFDSIVWTCQGMPDRVVSLRNTSGHHEVSYQLSSYFFHVNTDGRLTQITAYGYKGGRIVYGSGTAVTLWNQGFLGYDFSSSDLQHPSNPDEDMRCIFDQGKRFRLLSPRISPEYPNCPYVELRSIVTITPSDDDSHDSSLEKTLEKEKKELADLMDSYYGMYNSYEGSKHVVVDESNIEKYRSYFKALPKDADIVMYWYADTPFQNSGYNGSHVALIWKKDKENPQKSYYYIHAEPRK